MFFLSVELSFSVLDLSLGSPAGLALLPRCRFPIGNPVVSQAISHTHSGLEKKGLQKGLFFSPTLARILHVYSFLL